MKKGFSLCLVVVCSILLFGCAQTNKNTPPQTEAFSYEEVMSVYAPLKDGAGVHFDGFVNTNETTVENAEQAIALAKAECKSNYPTASVRFDADAKMWEVNFSQNSPDDDYLIAGGCVSVYMTDKGITTLIVAGE